MTALKSGEWDELGDLIAEALDEVDEMADERDIKLTKTEVVIYEVSGSRPSAPGSATCSIRRRRQDPVGSARPSRCASSRDQLTWPRASAAPRR